MGVEGLLKTIRTNNPEADLDLVRLAYDYAAKAHEGQKRASGEPYITHPLAVARYLAEINLDTSMIIAGLLHDVPEDTGVTIEDVEKNFGSDVASMVSGITKLGKIKYRGVERYIENLRKMFIAIAQDVRIMIIKFADRLHNLKTLGSLPENKRYRIALESLEIFAPIAGRLGMGEIKGQLEDLSFKYVDPENYQWVTKLQTESSSERNKNLEQTRIITEKEFHTTGIPIISFHGRVKHIYSLYRKLIRYNKEIDKIYDIVALRVIVPTIADCYATLGIIHKLWRPVPNRIKDYIAQPKPNGYQSLHTATFCLEGEIVEFQIRTEKMHEEAEYGIAAHWQYKDGIKERKIKEITWINELAQIQKTVFKNIKDIENLKIDFFQNRIFVWTPKGDIIDLPEEATPIDFAYAIHTDVGNKCVGCRINNQLSSLDTSLRNGDIVDIITDKKRKGPNPGWLKFVKTNGAKSRIKSYAKSSLTDWIKDKLSIMKKDKNDTPPNQKAS
ncbi:MAG: RelA/SpoT family protein [Candidatus Magasanikbacteria bacterium]|nr:RelA/SpoT family protein [Candidatus Magasanikbacteria bacterium]